MYYSEWKQKIVQIFDTGIIMDANLEILDHNLISFIPCTTTVR